jgi:G3E family GTPase
MLEKSSLHVNIANQARLFGQPFPDEPGGKLRSVTTRHADVDVITLTWPLPFSRAAFSKAMSVLQTMPDVDLLRIKGLVRFEGEKDVYVVHGVHAQLYPIMPLASPSGAGPLSGVRGSVIVFVVRAADRDGFERQASRLLAEQTVA